MPLGNQVKVLVDCLKQDKDLCGFSGGTPGCEAGDISKEDGAVWKKVGDRLVIALCGKFVATQECFELMGSGYKSLSLPLLILLCLHRQKAVTDLLRLQGNRPVSK